MISLQFQASENARTLLKFHEFLAAVTSDGLRPHRRRSNTVDPEAMSTPESSSLPPNVRTLYEQRSSYIS